MQDYHIIKSIKTENDTITVKLLGSLGVDSSEVFYEAIQQYLDNYNHLILDMEQMPYITSAGIRSLFRAAKKLATHDGDVTAIHVNQDVMGIFDLMNVGSVINVEP